MADIEGRFGNFSGIEGLGAHSHDDGDPQAAQSGLSEAGYGDERVVDFEEAAAGGSMSVEEADIALDHSAGDTGGPY